MGTSVRKRREKVLAEIMQSGHATVHGLANMLAVSEPTVRRDLRALAASEEIKLVYGGATLPRTYDPSFRARLILNAEARKVIGRLARPLSVIDWCVTRHV
jgi:DeoR family transcriptional regulator, glycerol-3-phosphate regulon repressor